MIMAASSPDCTDELPEPKYNVGHWVRTEFCRGGIKDMTHGRIAKWGYDEWYYLLRIPRYKDHWVRESEVLHRAWKEVYAEHQGQILGMGDVEEDESND